MRTEFRSFDPADERSVPPAFRPFEYLHFAKHRMGGSRFPLCLSGVPAQVPTFDPDVVRRSFVTGDLGTPLAGWRAAVAAARGIPPDHALPALGASGAVFLALAALGAREGARRPIAIEFPAYDVFRSVATLLGHPVIDVPRRADGSWSLDLDAVDAAFARGAAVYCATHLHNPTGVALAPSDIEALDAIAARHGRWVLLDEVYRDFLPGPLGTAYRPGGRIVSVGSYTKVYGLGPLRAGWVLGPPDVLALAEHVEEAAFGVPPSPWLEIVSAATGDAAALRERGIAAAAAGRKVIDAWIRETPGVSWTPPAGGITGLLNIDGLRDAAAFAARLRAELDVQVVPGSYFGAEGHVRVSFGLPPDAVRAALDVLALGIPPLVQG